MENNNGIEARPIEPWPTKTLAERVASYDIQPLPYDHKLQKVELTIGEKLYITYTKSKMILAGIVLTLKLLSLIEGAKESNTMLGTLKIFGRILKMVGAAVGAGGWMSGLVSPDIAAGVFAVTIFIGDAIVMIGDFLDDKKFNKSFSIDG